MAGVSNFSMSLSPGTQLWSLRRRYFCLFTRFPPSPGLLRLQNPGNSISRTPLQISTEPVGCANSTDSVDVFSKSLRRSRCPCAGLAGCDGTDLIEVLARCCWGLPCSFFASQLAGPCDQQRTRLHQEPTHPPLFFWSPPGSTHPSLLSLQNCTWAAGVMQRKGQAG